jgi:hypothetical protein
MTNTSQTVFVSAFVEQDDGALKFVDADEFNEGWVVQLRTPTPDDEDAPFEIEDQAFLADQPSALRTAQEMAKQNACKVVEN